MVRRPDSPQAEEACHSLSSTDSSLIFPLAEGKGKTDLSGGDSLAPLSVEECCLVVPGFVCAGLEDLSLSHTWHLGGNAWGELGSSWDHVQSLSWLPRKLQDEPHASCRRRVAMFHV